MKQSQSQSQSQSEQPADTTGRQSPGGGSAAPSSAQENAEWQGEVDQASASEEHSADEQHTPAGYGDRGQGGQPELTEGAPTQAEQPDASRHPAPDSEHARQAGAAERNGGAFLDE